METMRAQFQEIHELNEQMQEEIESLQNKRMCDKVALDQGKKHLESLKADYSYEIQTKERIIATLKAKVNEFELLLAQKDQ